MSGNKSRTQLRRSRHQRVRKKIVGNADRPRMSVMVSNKHMYVQFIDDERRHTLACASTMNLANGGPNVVTARELGKVAAVNAKEAGIERVVVDRGGFRFHGRVKAIVDAAAQNGIRIGKHERQVSAEVEDESKPDDIMEGDSAGPADDDNSPADETDAPINDTATGPDDEETT